MKKRGVALLMAAVFAVANLSGCGRNAGGDGTLGEKEKVRLMVWSPSEDQSKESGEWLQSTCEKFAEEHPEWDITFVYGVADEATAASQVAQDPEESADVFMYANDTLTTMTDAKALAKFGGKYREEIENTNSEEVLSSLIKDGDLYGYHLRRIRGLCTMIKVFFRKKILRIWIACWKKGLWHFR